MTNLPAIIQNSNPNLYLLDLDYFEIDDENDVFCEKDILLYEVPVIAFSITASDNPKNRRESVGFHTDFIGWDGGVYNCVIIDKSTWHFYVVESQDGLGIEALLTYLNERAQSDLKRRIT